MSALCTRILSFSARKPIRFMLAAKHTSMGDPIEHATGLEKREMLAKMSGNENPFDIKVIKRGCGTKETPNEIPSAFDARLIGCICEEESTSISWMWLHKGEPKRCECGHWFCLVHKAPL